MISMTKAEPWRAKCLTREVTEVQQDNVIKWESAKRLIPSRQRRKFMRFRIRKGVKIVHFFAVRIEKFNKNLTAKNSDAITPRPPRGYGAV